MLRVLSRQAAAYQQYDVLLQIAPSPGARVARAVAVAEAEGPAPGLVALDEVHVVGGHRQAAVRAELLTRLGRTDEARAAYEEAIGRCRNETEPAHLRERLSSL